MTFTPASPMVPHCCCFPLSFFVPHMPDHRLARHLGMFLAVYLISIRILLCACFSFPVDPSPLRTLKLSLLAPSRSSKGPLFHSLDHMSLFGITTIIFILCTTVIVLGPGLMSQGIPIEIKKLDPSFDKAWSPHKVHIVQVIIAVITRLNARFPPSFNWSLVVE